MQPDVRLQQTRGQGINIESVDNIVMITDLQWSGRAFYVNIALLVLCMHDTLLGIPIPNPGILGSRTIFSILNPGIGNALIPGFRGYEK